MPLCGTRMLYWNASCMLGTVPSDASARMPAADVYSRSNVNASLASALTTWNRLSNCSAGRPHAGLVSVVAREAGLEKRDTARTDDQHAAQSSGLREEVRSE